MNVPLFGLIIPRPWVWLIAQGIRRDWVVDAELAPLLHQRVALISSLHGDHAGWHDFDHWLTGTPLTHTRKEVEREAPHEAIVGLSTIASLSPRADGVRVGLTNPRPLAPIPLVVGAGIDLVGLPGEARRQLAAVLRERAA